MRRCPGRGKKEEGRRKKEEERRKKEEVRRKKEERNGVTKLTYKSTA
jgi:hypothetical protein